jgi:hypothetical protein
MPPPGAGQLISSFFRDQEIAPQCGLDFGLLSSFAPGEIRRLVLCIILQQG